MDTAGGPVPEAAGGAFDPSLRPFFRPAGIAVLGATADATKLGHGLARNLVRSGYAGAIHFVNPGGGALFGRPLYRSVADVPEPVDLAVVLIPAPHVPEALQACGARGIRAVVVESGGFRETGADGLALEEACLAVAHRHGMRLLGPNGIGLLDTHVPFDLTFLGQPPPRPGDVAFVSHSGALCAAAIDWANGQGLGLSQLISAGNQADVTETELLEGIAAGPHTRVVALYLEGLRDGRRFVDVCRRVSRTHPIVALKVGRSEGGRRAVVSHTGALAGREAAVDAAFAKAGVLRAATSEELFDWARVLSWCPLPRGRAVAVLTNAGGPGVAAADAVEAHGLHLAGLGAATQAALRALLPPAASVANPVDLLASATPDLFAASLRLLLADAAVDAVLVVSPPPPPAPAADVAAALLPVIAASGKPVVAAWMGDALVREAVAAFRAARVPSFAFPERAAAALAVLARRAASRAEEPPDAPLGGLDAGSAAALLDGAPPGLLPADTAARLLRAYGIAAPALSPAASANDAVAAARRLGFPVALKLDAPAVTHKTDAGGVRLGLADEPAVREAFDAIVQAARSTHPEAAVRGVFVQPMAGPGDEVIAGAVRDPQFGPLLMFGAGGVEVEGRRDVAFALAPVSTAEAEGLLQATWAGRRLAGFRGAPPADRAAVVDVLRRLARLTLDVPAIAEVEINPLRVYAEGRGAEALDVRIRVA